MIDSPWPPNIDLSPEAVLRWVAHTEEARTAAQRAAITAASKAADAIMGSPEPAVAVPAPYTAWSLVATQAYRVLRDGAYAHLDTRHPAAQHRAIPACDVDHDAVREWLDSSVDDPIATVADSLGIHDSGYGIDSPGLSSQLRNLIEAASRVGLCGLPEHQVELRHLVNGDGLPDGHLLTVVLPRRRPAGQPSPVHPRPGRPDLVGAGAALWTLDGAAAVLTTCCLHSPEVRWAPPPTVPRRPRTARPPPQRNGRHLVPRGRPRHRHFHNATARPPPHRRATSLRHELRRPTRPAKPATGNGQSEWRQLPHVLVHN